MRRLIKCAVGALVLLPVVAVGATPKLAPGLWEMTSKTEMVGVPFQVPSRTYKTCLKAAQLAHPWQQLQSSPKQHCSFSDVKMQGHSVSWKIRCNGADGNMSGSGSSEFADPHHFHGITYIKMRTSGETMRMKVDTVGRWVASSCHG